MKKLFGVLVMAVFAVGIGIGGLIGANLPANDAFTFESSVASSRALNVQSVDLAPKASTSPLKSVPVDGNLGGPVERDSPSDWIAESQIEMRADGVFVRFSDPQWAILADTNSMDPVFDDGSHLIQKIVTNKEEVHVGDIVSYQAPLGFTIVHRVVEIGTDEEGWYAILKGDNNPTPDPWKVRFDMVRRVTVMVIY